MASFTSPQQSCLQQLTLHPNLKYGDVGPEIQIAQHLINLIFSGLGLAYQYRTFSIKYITENGEFTEQTEYAIRLLQYLTWQTINGILSPSLWQFLYQGPSGLKILRYGCYGPTIVKLQTKLNLPATGFFNQATEKAVQNYQIQHHLSPTGIVAASTWLEFLFDNIESDDWKTFFQPELLNLKTPTH